ncbi:MAG: hypothetical protein ACO3EZ_15115 [Prochlorotrichaceae cyanobacterium]
MPPNLTSAESWQQANLLLQPIFIRLIDHLRKILEESAWIGEYQNREIWPDFVEESVKLHRQELLQQLETIAPEAADPIKAELATLPAPYPGYELFIFLKDQTEGEPLARFDLWELCYQICFSNYLNTPDAPPAIVDQTLLDEEGEVEWNQVDQKTGKVVAQLFEQLPTV